MASVQLLQVINTSLNFPMYCTVLNCTVLYCTVLYCTVLQVINTSLNFPIYWFVGNFREIFLAIFCGWGKKADTKPGLGTLGRAGGN